MPSGALVIVAVVGALIGGAILAFVPLAVLVHEGGHAVAAWLVGFRVLRVELGRGRPWAVRRRWGIDLALAGWLVGGKVVVARDEEAGWRWRFAAVCAGGPIANAVVAGLALGAALNEHNIVLAGLPYTFAVTNTILLVNLLSFERPSPDGEPPRPSDGRQLLRMLRGDAALIRASWLAALEAEIEGHLGAGRIDEARARAAALLIRAPHSFVAMVVR